MKHLKHRTQYTRDQMDGKKDPQRDMTNRKALEQPLRAAKRLRKIAAENQPLINHHG